MRPLLSALGLSRLAPGDIDFISGPGPRTLDLPSWGKVGFQLCYEIIFSGEVVDRRNRPDFIFNPSNDAWFGSWGPPQHLAQARLRAVEEGHSGAALDADRDQRGDRCARGSCVKALPGGRRAIIDAQLPRPPRRRRSSPGSAMSSRCCSASRSLIAAIALGRARTLSAATHKAFFI